MKSFNKYFDFAARLLVSAFVISLLFITCLEFSRKLLVIQPIQIPAALSESGYTGEVMASRIRDEIHNILSEVNELKDNRKALVTHAIKPAVTPITSYEVTKPDDITVLGTGLNLGRILAYFKHIANLENTTIAGDLVRIDNELTLRLRITDPREGLQIAEIQSENVETLITEAGREYFRQVEPFILATYHNKRGADFINIKRFADARSEFERAISEFQQWKIVPTQGIKETYTAATPTDRAFAILEHAISEFERSKIPRDMKGVYIAETLTNWGLALSELDDIGEAERKFRKAIESCEKCPERAYTYVIWGRVRARRGDDKEEIEKMFADALRADPNYDYTYVVWGDFLLERKEYGLAVDKLRKAIEHNSEQALAHVLLGRALAAQNNSEGAVAEFAKAVKVDPTYDYAYVAWGDFLLEERDPTAAEKFREAVKLNPNHDYALVRWGETLAAHGDHDGALDKFKEAVHAGGGSSFARVRLGEALAAQGDSDAAFREFEQVSREDLDYDYTYVAWGKVLFDTGDTGAAIEKFKEAICYNGDHAEAHARLGQALAAQGDRARAIAELQKALELEPSPAFPKEKIESLLRELDYFGVAEASKRFLVAFDECSRDG